MKLMMLKGVCSAMGLMAALSVSAGEKIDRSIEANPNGYVEIEHVNGKAEIKGWDKSQVQVKGELGENTERFVFERRGNEVLIKVKVKNSRKHSSRWGNDNEDELIIFVPYQSRINYTAVNADVRLGDIKGGTNAQTVNGEIDAQQLSGRVRLESVNGDINADALKGDVTIETVNGDIRSQSTKGREDAYKSVNGDINVTSSSKELRVTTVNGDVTLAMQKITYANLETVNGELKMALALAKGGELQATTVGGEINLNFAPDVSALFDIRAHAGGKIVNRLTHDKVQKDKYGPSSWLATSIGQGQGKVSVSTVNGRVSISKG
ncbi:DUF4097 family beta strand repeat-containing protein [Paraglaciecola chathamensis]|uniref:DUF4097 family beta strand repeat-containing protein n=1 Tax=Paraglaciecola chathamensis TaxID=368405 RepID=UPI0027095F89|nr:DUF4097 family beta strand repeat-containing protein [Paraglaciecola chathamensis]MDO6839099.1 DUF4097 family beta strand repeat-containing protein [Paraglaciecola chathamensis]